MGQSALSLGQQAQSPAVSLLSPNIGPVPEGLAYRTQPQGFLSHQEL